MKVMAIDARRTVCSVSKSASQFSANQLTNRLSSISLRGAGSREFPQYLILEETSRPDQDGYPGLLGPIQAILPPDLLLV